MKQFFKFMLAAMTGCILAMITFSIFFIGFFTVMYFSINKAKTVDIVPNSVLHIKLNYPISDRTTNNPFDKIDFPSFEVKYNPGLNEILRNINEAKYDDNIKGIYLDLSLIIAGYATIDEIRVALEDFKKSKKFIYCYGNIYSQRAYYLSSVADEIYLHPAGLLEFKGLGGQTMFFKHAFEKLEVEPVVIRHGKYKSAAESFTSDKFSDENRKQITSLIGSIWDHILTNISTSRKISTTRLNTIADSILVRLSGDAVKLGLIDGVFFEDEMHERIKEQIGLQKDDKLNLLSMKNYSQTSDKTPEAETLPIDATTGFAFFARSTSLHIISDASALPPR